jgi:hypothetical protein
MLVGNQSVLSQFLTIEYIPLSSRHHNRQVQATRNHKSGSTQNSSACEALLPSHSLFPICHGESLADETTEKTHARAGFAILKRAAARNFLVFL